VSGERLKILLAGMVAGDPCQGGATWAVLQYVAGLRALGHDVVLVEPVGVERTAADPRIVPYFEGLPLLDGRAALLDEAGGGTVGLPAGQLAAFAAEADLLLNVSGMLRDERLLEPIPVRAFLDLDPGFNQVWQEAGVEMGFDRHTHLVTVGGLVGSAECLVPTLGREWIHTLPPVALDHWPVVEPGARRRGFTTVGHWRSYGSIEHEGVSYGQRAHSLRELVDLPSRALGPFELALGIHPDETADLAGLRDNGWVLLDPGEMAGSPADYRQFIGESTAELGVAKSGYVASHSGWFSDRSACYLASGRPVLAQDTGFSRLLPTGEGLLSFSTSAEAAAGAALIEADFERQSALARELAIEYLDSNAVLTRLIEALV
jgi:hypothetical protein